MRLLTSLAALSLASSVLATAAAQSCVPKGAPPVRPAITGIAFVSFYVDPGQADSRFYGTELGLHPVAGADGTTVYPVNNQQWIETRPAPAEIPRNDRQAAVGLTTPNVQQMAKYLASKGYSPADGARWKNACEPVVSHGRFSVHDPEGNTIFFVQPGSEAQVTRSTTSSQAISRRIIHAGFVAEDEAKENAFYRDILGFKPYWRGGMKDDKADWVSQQVPNGTDWIEYMLNIKPDATASSRGVMNHVSLGVDTMDTAVAQLKANGCDTQECTSPKMGRDGKVQLNLYDPHHTRVEVMEFKPTGPICCSPYTGAMPTSNLPSGAGAQ